MKSLSNINSIRYTGVAESEAALLMGMRFSMHSGDIDDDPGKRREPPETPGDNPVEEPPDRPRETPVDDPPGRPREAPVEEPPERPGEIPPVKEPPPADSDVPPPDVPPVRLRERPGRTWFPG